MEIYFLFAEGDRQITAIISGTYFLTDSVMEEFHKALALR